MKEISYNKKGEMLIGKVSAIDLAKQFKTPLYVYNQSEIEEKCQLFSEVLDSCYPNFMVSYASKAFCCKAIYQITNKYGFGCDVVSLAEMATALAAKVDPNKIFFHGNNKTEEEIDFALKNNVFNFIVDNKYEYELLCKKVDKNKSLLGKINVLVRINPGIEAHTHEFVQTSKTDSKFGINLGQDAEKFVVQLAKEGKLNFSGVHFHIGSQIFETQPYILSLQKIMDFVLKLKQKYNVDTKVLDIGGGFGVSYTQKDKEFQKQDYTKLFKSVSNIISKYTTTYNLVSPKLVIEPGRSLVATAGTTIYKVGNIKDIKGVRKYICVDGGMFEAPRYALYQAEYTAISCKKSQEKPEKVTIVGKCCESGDIIAKDVKLSPVNSGDYIAVLTTGAYHHSMASNYNKNPIPPVVFVNNNKPKLVVKGQTLKDLLKFDL